MQGILKLGQSREDKLQRVALKIDEAVVSFALQVVDSFYLFIFFFWFILLIQFLKNCRSFCFSLEGMTPLIIMIVCNRKSVSFGVVFNNMVTLDTKLWILGGCLCLNICINPNLKQRRYYTITLKYFLWKLTALQIKLNSLMYR